MRHLKDVIQIVLDMCVFVAMIGGLLFMLWIMNDVMNGGSP